MTMTTHINHVLSSCFSALRQVRSINRSLPSHALDTLVTSLVHSRLDYCNVVFAGLPARDLQRLQSVLNATVWLVSNSSSRCHVTLLLRDRHWLPIRQRVQYKLCTLVHRCPYVPTEKHHLISPNSSSRLPSPATELLVWGRHSCCPSPCHVLTRHSAIARSPSQLGTTFHRTYRCKTHLLHGRLLKEFEIFLSRAF